MEYLTSYYHPFSATLILTHSADQMGNYRFRLSDMMPNAWFYKLRDMSKVKNQNPCQKKLQSSSIQNPRKSFYCTGSIRMDKNLCHSPTNPKFFDTPFPCDPPRKSSSKKKSKRKTIYMPSPRKITPSQEPESPVWIKPATLRHQNCFDSPDHQGFMESLSESEYGDDSIDDGNDDHQSISSCSCKLTSSGTDIIINVDETSYASINIDSFTKFNVLSEPELPPILTKPPPVKFPAETTKESQRCIGSPGTGRKSFSRSGGVKIRGNGRRIAGKKAEKGRRKSVKREKKGMFYSESFAIVKASFDPEKDFRESMMEMIVENNIRASKDLEELLACYLSLNSNQYHDLIIKAFEQIWFNMPQPLSVC